MSSASNQAAIGLLFDVQMLSQQNETQRKQMDERRRQVESNDIALEQSTQEDIKETKSRADGKDVLSRRQDVVRAMMNKAGKAAEAKQTAKTAQGPTKTSGANKGNKTQGKTTLTPPKSAFSEKQMLALGKTFNDLTKMGVQAQGLPELKFNPEKDDLLETLFKRSNLTGCKATNAQLAQAKAKAKKMSRLFRQVAAKSLPTATNAVAKALAKKGIDLSDPKNQTPKNNDIDQSIYASIIESLEINELLQELGIKTESVEMDFQNEMSKELLADSETTFETNSKAIAKAHHQECLQKVLKGLGDFIGVLFIATGLPIIGLPILLAANGVIEKMVSSIAKALHIPEYVVKSVIVALTIIIAIIVNTITLGSCTGLCIGAVLFVAGLVGWITDTLGAMATGQFDESKFPGWVTWAALGINIALALMTGGESLLSLVRAIGGALMGVGSLAAEGLSSLFSSLAESVSSLMNSSEAVVSEVSEVTGAANGLAEDGEALANARGATTEAPASAPEANSAPAPASGPLSSAGDASGATTNSSSASMGEVQGSSGTNGGSTGSAAADEVGQASANGTAPNTPTQAPSTPNASATSAQPENAMTTSNTAAVRATLTNLEAMSLPEVTEGEAIAPTSSAQGAPNANMEAISETQPEGTDTRTLQEKMIEFLRKSFTKMLTKLIELKNSLLGGAEDASEAAGLLKGSETAAEKAEQITQTIAKVLRIIQRLSRWLLLLSQGAQAIVEFEIAQCTIDLGKLLKETAELTGKTELFEQYVTTFNAVISETKDSEGQYAQDMASELELLGAVISTQRRNSTMLLSA